MSKKVASYLVRHGKELFNAPRVPLVFTGVAAADSLLNDLEVYPHAFVVACVTDRQIKAEKAWLIPHQLCQRLGGFEFGHLRCHSLKQLRRAFRKPDSLHRFPDEMSQNVYLAIQRIADEYKGDAARMWLGERPSAEVVLRFLAFRGIGPKIATMAANILARDFKVPFTDYYSVDVSVDVHLRRVFTRLGLIEKDASVAEVVYRARALHPPFPGLLVFQLGRLVGNGADQRSRGALIATCRTFAPLLLPEWGERANQSLQPTPLTRRG